MKSSQRVLLTTLGIVLCLITAFVVLARITLSQMEHPSKPETLSAIDLQDLREFSAVSAKGDWNIELRQGDEWKVTIEPPKDHAENIQVYVFQQQLFLKQKNSAW